ncbi:MAG: hypothetical protein U0228_08395 [Myxococcaceae bacterium]
MTPVAVRTLVAVLSLGVLAGCKHTFPTPYTMTQLSQDSERWPGEALVHYLKQENADVAVCELGSTNALHRLDDDLVDPFVTALEEENLRAERWQACATKLVPSVQRELREYFLGRLAKVVLALLTDETGAARLIAAHEVFASRPREPSPSLDALTERLLGFDRGRLPPGLPPVFDSLVTTLEFDKGSYLGKPLTVADIEANQDDGLLMRMATRLPTEDLRNAAKHRLVQLRIARSEWPEVKNRAAEVEAAVVATGRWAQSAASLELARPDPPLSLPFNALVKQDVSGGRATLLAPGEKHAEVLPTLDLKPHVKFPVKWSRPLGLCRAPEVMAVDPCVDRKEVEFQGIAKVDGEGVMHLPDTMPMQQAFELARSGDGALVMSVRLKGQLVTSLSVPLRYLRPQPSYFEGAVGQKGPSVNVAAQTAGDLFLLEAVSETGERRYVVLARGDAQGFEFGSMGGHGMQGYEGAKGTDGSKGYNGMNASCPSTPATSGGPGGIGGPGGNGGDGGPGGDGGLVQVSFRCAGPSCAGDAVLLRSVIRSRGGPGGRGGSGGRGGTGGAGGNGGSGTSCTVNGTTQSLSSGSSGAKGADGQRGYDGRQGPDGADGLVKF